MHRSGGTGWRGTGCNLRVIHRPDKRLRSILGPVLLVVELLGVPNNLVHELGHADGVRGRARATALEGASLGVRHVALVVGAVEVLAVPACWETHIGHDAVCAGGLGKIHAFGVSGACILQTRVGYLSVFICLLLGPVRRLADKHAESRLERCYFGSLLVVGQSVLL